MSNEVQCRKCNLLVIAISNYDGEASLGCVEAGLEMLRQSRFYRQDCEGIECINSAATELGIVEQVKAWIGRMDGSGPELVHTCIFLGHGVNVHGLSCMVTVDKKLIPIWDLYNHLCQKHSLSVALFFDCCQGPPHDVFSEPNRGLFPYEKSRAGWCDWSQIRLSISSSPGQYAEDASVVRRVSSYISQLVQALDACDRWDDVFYHVSKAIDRERRSRTPFCVGHAIWRSIQRSSPRPRSPLSFDDSGELDAMSNEAQCRKCNLLVIAISNYDGEASLDGVEAGLEMLRQSRFYRQDCEGIECINSAATELGIVEQVNAWIGLMDGSGPELVHTCIFFGHGVNVDGLSCMVTVDKKLIPIWDLYNHLCQKHSLSVALFFDCCQSPDDGFSEPNRGLFPYETATAGWCDRSQIRLSISSSPGQYADDASAASGVSSYTSQLVQSLDKSDWWEEVFDCVSMAGDSKTESQTPFSVGHAIWQSIQRSSPCPRSPLSFDSSELGATSQ